MTTAILLTRSLMDQYKKAKIAIAVMMSAVLSSLAYAILFLGWKGPQRKHDAYKNNATTWSHNQPITDAGVQDTISVLNTLK
jgi:hypothetical protein